MTDNIGLDKLEEMSDGALRKAIQSLENAKGSTEYAILMIPDDTADDISSSNGPAKDAVHRIQQQLSTLYAELERRTND